MLGVGAEAAAFVLQFNLPLESKCVHSCPLANYKLLFQMITQCMLFVENMSPRTIDGSTPLHYAASNGHSELCKIIMNWIEEKEEEKNP